jgi:hypothetical protein
MTSSAHIVIEKLGGTRKAAALLDLPPSTVQSWKRAGFIPAKHQRDILAKAEGAEIVLTASDLIVSVEATKCPQNTSV